MGIPSQKMGATHSGLFESKLYNSMGDPWQHRTVQLSLEERQRRAMVNARFGLTHSSTTRRWLFGHLHWVSLATLPSRMLSRRVSELVRPLAWKTSGDWPHVVKHLPGAKRNTTLKCV